MPELKFLKEAEEEAKKTAGGWATKYLSCVYHMVSHMAAACYRTCIFGPFFKLFSLYFVVVQLHLLSFPLRM